MCFRNHYRTAMKDQIAERIKAGDEKAFELRFRKHYIRLCILTLFKDTNNYEDY